LKKNILIYGGGNIALRHVQSIISEKEISKIYIYDKKKSSLKKMSVFFENYKYKKKLIFCENQKIIKNKFFFLVFLCTYAFNRIPLIKKIKARYNVKYFIVEKILESNISNFSRIEFNTKNIFVNMPIRNIGPFRIIKTKLNTKKVNATLKGKNWHMICNSLHYINYISYVTKSSVKSILIKKLDKPYNLIRKNFIDFHGKILVSYKNGSKLSLVSEKNTNKHYFNLKQGKKNFIYNFKNEKLFLEKKSFICKREYTSELSSKFFKSLLKYKKVKLPTFEEALEENFIFIKEFLKNIKQKSYIFKVT
jgi:hypothetical protein